MQTEKPVTYLFSNGQKYTKSKDFAESYCKINNCRIVDCWEYGDDPKQKGRIRDGFQPGWQSNIQEFCWSIGTYNKALNRLGMVEMGKEKPKNSGHRFERESKVSLTDDEFRQANEELKLGLTESDVREIRTVNQE